MIPGLLFQKWQGRHPTTALLSPLPAPASRFAPHPVLQLQRNLGNQAVQRLLRDGQLPAGVIQPKLTVNAAGDRYEQEADHIANRVMTMPEPVTPGSVQREIAPDEDKKPVQTKPLATSITPLVQREMVPEEEEKEKPVQAKSLLQRMDGKESFEAGSDFEGQLNHTKGGGSPLPENVRAFMEPRFGVDLSPVRTHADSQAAQMNQAVGAQAFTHGHDIYYGAGKTPAVSDLTAHELTHVVQQTGGVQATLQRGCASCATGGSTCPKCRGQMEPIGPSGEGTLQRSPGPPPDKELVSPRFAGNATLKEVLNRRALLRSGSSGDAVKLMQEALLEEGYELPKFGADGKFGDETGKAVREFQTRWRLKVDGIVGDQTLGLLDIHDVAKGALALGERLPDFLGGLVKRGAASVLDTAEKERAQTACPAADKAERLTGCLEPVVIANDDGTSPTAAPSLSLTQRIWEKCCINYSALPVKTVKKTSFKTLDESPTNVPTAEESALFAAASGSSCIQIFVPENFEQAGVISKDISGGGATYDGGTANPKVVVVEGTVPAVVAHEVGHASGHAGHDANDTVMKPTGSHSVANSSKVSSTVCADARTGSCLSKTSGKDDCCMFPK